MLPFKGDILRLTRGSPLEWALAPEPVTYLLMTLRSDSPDPRLGLPVLEPSSPRLCRVRSPTTEVSARMSLLI